MSNNQEKDMKKYRNTAREIMDSISENTLGQTEEVRKQQFQTALANQMSKSKDTKKSDKKKPQKTAKEKKQAKREKKNK